MSVTAYNLSPTTFNETALAVKPDKLETVLQTPLLYFFKIIPPLI